MKFQDEKVSNIALLLQAPDEAPRLQQELLKPERLDYSINSLSHLDEFLLQVRQQEVNERDWATIILRCGAYVGEVMRRHPQGSHYHWIDYDDLIQIRPEMQEIGREIGNVLALHNAKADSTCFPMAKVQKLLINGPEDCTETFAIVLLSKVFTQKTGPLKHLILKLQKLWNTVSQTIKSILGI